MLRYALQRLLTAIPVLWIAVTACFFILRLAPGGPFDGERPLPPAVRRNIEAFYHLDRTLIEQYLLYIGGVLRGDLGPSFVNRDFQVAEQIANGLPYTLILGAAAFVVAILAGVVTGIVSALNRDRWPDILVATVVLLGLVLPNFLIAPILQLVFGIQLDWLPVGGWGGGSPANLVLPVIVLALPHVARISRLMRGALLETLNASWIRTARAKGLSPAKVLVRHALTPALVPVVSYLGPAAGFLLTGSIVVETIFGLPGIGRLFIDAALARDYGMVLGTVIFYMGLIVLLNLLVDLTYAWLDPRVRHR